MLVATGGLKLATVVYRLFHCPVANGCAAGFFIAAGERPKIADAHCDGEFRNPGGSGKRSLPMVCPIAIGKAFGLAAATRRYEIPNRQQLPVIGPAAAWDNGQ